MCNVLTEAVADANKAIELDPSMAKAYLRKGYLQFYLLGLYIFFLLLDGYA